MSNEPKIVQGSISAIKASDIRNVCDEQGERQVEVSGPDVGAAVASAMGIHDLSGVSINPPRVSAETMTYAVNLCRGIVVSIERMPLTQQAGDTIAIALALLHLSEECERLQADARIEAQRSANRFGSE